MNWPQRTPAQSTDMEPAGTIERARRWCQRHPILVVLVGTLALCVIVAIAATEYFSVDANNDATAKVAQRPPVSRAAEALSESTVAEQVREIAFYEWKIEADSKAQLAHDRRIQDEEDARLIGRRLYIKDMQLAQVAWENGQIGDVLDLLDRHRPMDQRADYRGFEWYYWNRLCHNDRLRINRDENKTQGIASDPAELQFVSESLKQTLKLGDAGGHDQDRPLEGHPGGVSSVIFSPDGKRIASTSQDGSVKIWDASTGEEMFTLKGNAGSASSVAFSPDGTRIASAGFGNLVKVCDTGSGNELLTLTGHADIVNCVVFSPDGTRIASASNDQTVKLWDAISGEESITLKGHTSAVLCVGFNPDQTRVASGSADGTVKIWNAPLERFP